LLSVLASLFRFRGTFHLYVLVHMLEVCVPCGFRARDVEEQTGHDSYLAGITNLSFAQIIRRIERLAWHPT
jgi:hypothetical protein